MSRLALVALLFAACTRPNENEITSAANDVQCLAAKKGGSTTGTSGGTTGSSGGASGLPAGSPCTSGSQCASGTVCSGPVVNATKACHQVCKSDSDCPQAIFPGGVSPLCVALSSGGVSVCSLSCNPVGATAGCAPGFSCAVRADINRLPPTQYTDCIVMGTAGLGGDCTAHGVTDCAPGLMCVNRGTTDGSSGCFEVCDPSQSTTCSDGTTCNPNIFNTYGDGLF
jgi:hypothetical protein